MSLYFTPVDKFSTANPFIVMRWSQFSIPEAAMFPDLVYFNVRAFTAFTRDIAGLGMTFNPVNDFLQTVSIEEQKTIATAFLVMHIEIADPQYTVDKIEQLEDKLGVLVNSLDDEISLCDRINNYIRHSGIPISDMAEAGTRPQDTPEMTFLKDEAITITTIAILMKLMSPIVGAFLDKYHKLIDTKYKECHAAAIFTKLFYKRYEQIINKLHNYTYTLIESKIKDDATSLVNGNTIDAMTNQNIDVVLVKRLTNADLYKSDGNIIKYIASCCRSGADSQQQNASMSNSVKIFTDPVDMDKDEGNASRMESESKQSNKTADTPPMIEVAAEVTIRDIIEKENLDKDALESMYAYYRRNPIIVNPISIYLLSTYYGQYIGGGRGITFLRANSTAQLAAVLQMISAKNKVSYLAHALSFSIGTNEKIPSFEISTFSNSWKSSQIYSDCRKTIPQGFGEIDWDSKVKEIANFLTRKNCIYNTAPVIWDLLGEEPKNGKLFENNTELMIEIMQFIASIYSSKCLI